MLEGPKDLGTPGSEGSVTVGELTTGSEQNHTPGPPGALCPADKASPPWWVWAQSLSHMKSYLETPNQGKINSVSSGMTTRGHTHPRLVGVLASASIQRPHPPPSGSSWPQLLPFDSCPGLFVGRRKRTSKVSLLQTKAIEGSDLKVKVVKPNSRFCGPGAVSSLCWNIKTDPWDWFLRKLTNHEQG